MIQICNGRDANETLWSETKMRPRLSVFVRDETEIEWDLPKFPGDRDDTQTLDFGSDTETETFETENKLTKHFSSRRQNTVGQFTYLCVFYYIERTSWKFVKRVRHRGDCGWKLRSKFGFIHACNIVLKLHRAILVHYGHGKPGTTGMAWRRAAFKLQCIAIATYNTSSVRLLILNNMQCYNSVL